MRARGLAIVVLVGCASRSELDAVTGTDASADAIADANGRHAHVDGAMDAGPADVGANIDAAACLALPEASCTCQDPSCDASAGPLLEAAWLACANDAGWTCGDATVTFDANGCVARVDYVGGHIEAAFRACFEGIVGSQRWSCVSGAALFVFLGSCTIN